MFKKALQLLATLEDYDSEYTDHPDFVGFHCQKSPRNKYDDFIGAQYGGGIDQFGIAGGTENYLIHILDSLYDEYRYEAIELGLMDVPEDSYSDEYREWANKVEDFLAEKNIKWLFVSETKTLSDYGGYCYYVLLPDDIVLETFHDLGVNDIAMAYVYDANKGQPTCIEIEDA